MSPVSKGTRVFQHVNASYSYSYKGYLVQDLPRDQHQQEKVTKNPWKYQDGASTSGNGAISPGWRCRDVHLERHPEKGSKKDGKDEYAIIWWTDMNGKDEFPVLYISYIYKYVYIYIYTLMISLGTWQHAAVQLPRHWEIRCLPHGRLSRKCPNDLTSACHWSRDNIWSGSTCLVCSFRIFKETHAETTTASLWCTEASKK